jgi:hypothetical protein
VFSYLMNGLREVHANKLLHLDIKPANIFLSMDGRPVLLDFGAARITLSEEAMKLKPMYTAASPRPSTTASSRASWGPGATSTRWARRCTPASRARPARRATSASRRTASSRSARSRGSSIRRASIARRVVPLGRYLKRPQTAFDLQKLLMEEQPRGEAEPPPRDAQHAAVEALLALARAMRFTIFQDSKVGDRQGNEDRVGYSYSRDVLLMTIADGMGGHDMGEVAAEIAVSEITSRFQTEARNRLQRPFDFLVTAIQAAHRAIVSYADQKNMLECPRTTCVACVVQGGRAFWAHSGDSRLYVIRKGEVVAKTRTTRRCSR